MIEIIDNYNNQYGYYVVRIKVNGLLRVRVRVEKLHRLVWQTLNGPIPKGYVIHHIDKDKHNNDIKNLACLPWAEHSRLHQVGSSRSSDTKEKISIANRKGLPRMRPVRCIDTNETFSSVRDAAKSINRHSSCITVSIKNNIRTGGFYWEYID